MKITKINILNLNSLYGEVVIDLENSALGDTGLFAITGDTGAGKSTILDAITLALYGKIPRNNSVLEVMSHGTGECRAEVHFRVQDREYLSKWILRRAHGKPDGNIQQPQMDIAVAEPERGEYRIIEDKKSKVPQTVSDITGLDYERFTRSVMLAQGEFAAFLKANSNERSDLLERITGTEIYSQISKAAHERHRLEVQKYDHIRESADAIDMMTEEERESQFSEMKAFQSAEEEISKKLTALREDLEFLNKLNETTESLNRSEAKNSAIRHELETRKPAFNRLKGHEIARPVLPILNNWKDCQTSLKTFQKSLTAHKETHRDIQERLKKAKHQQELASDQVREAEARKKEWRPRIEQAKNLYAQIKNLNATLEEFREEGTVKKSALDKKSAELSGLAESLEKETRRLKDYKQWIDDHSAYLELPEHIAAIQTDVELLLDVEKRIAKESESLRKAREQREKLEMGIRKASEDLAPLEQEQQSLQRKFQQAAGHHLKLSRKATLLSLSSYISSLRTTFQQVESLLDSTKNRLDVQSAITSEEERLKDLTEKEDTLREEIEQKGHELKTLREIEQSRFQMLEREQMAANYEKDRERLIEGDPCPLCGAVHHPFATSGNGQAGIDLARNDYETAKSACQQAENNLQSLIQEQVRIQSRKTGISNRQGSGVLDQHRKNLEKINALIQEKLSTLEHLDDFPEHPEEWHAYCNDLKSNLKNLESLSPKLEKLDDTLSQNEENIKSCQDRLTGTRIQLDAQNDSINRADREIESTKTLLKERQQKATRWQALFPTDATQSSAKKLLEFWQSLSTEMTMKTRAHADVQNALDKLQSAMEFSQNEFDRMTSDFNILKEKAESLKSTLKENREKLHALVGDQNPVQLENALEEALTKVLAIQKDASDTFIKLSNDETRVSTQIDETQERIEEYERRHRNYSAELKTALQKTPFESIAQLESALLPEAEASRLEAERKRLNDDLMEIQALLAKDRMTLEDLQNNKEDWNSLDKRKIIEDIREGEEKQREKSTLKGRIQERLKNDDRNREKKTEKLQILDRQEKEVHRWFLLKDLIGQSDGQKFRNYAQSLTLARLTQLANRHLRKLSGRYRIQKMPDQILDLMIVDDHQAGNTRSMNTLSGGESFLVSLALALALSDMASRTTSIQSLFIDEGFGTLDERTLDAAIATLENLQGTGKSIGIISHVPALKERIGTRIHVAKKSGGRSRVEIRNS